jgi:hypothetical protein
MSIVTLDDIITAIKDEVMKRGYPFFARGIVFQNTKDLAAINVVDVRLNGDYAFRRDVERMLNMQSPVGTKIVVKELNLFEKWTCWSLKKVTI